MEEYRLVVDGGGVSDVDFSCQYCGHLNKIPFKSIKISFVCGNISLTASCPNCNCTVSVQNSSTYQKAYACSCGNWFYITLGATDRGFEICCSTCGKRQKI